VAHSYNTKMNEAQREKEKDTIVVRNVKGYQKEHRGEKRVMGVNECKCGNTLTCNCEESEVRALMVMWGRIKCEKIRVNNIH